ncbi:hypothetical protein QCD85_10030 [Paenibacillus sp. PsM32]|uniref:hypothetical protein n=1 Tax=unclassified Paenibacillus TaxID=185978 RepID=UPI002365FC6D|nr:MULTISPECIES: hypothetical protein [unclassified Paenibacillus]MDN4618435.1 hypothetical protein [Paenibacillus sp. PsM32]WDF52928.1 hypothetical protein PQ460_11085 [Paenibacillus sp. KACC 21273]
MKRIKSVIRKCWGSIKGMGGWFRNFLNTKEGRYTVAGILLMVVKFVLTGGA